MVGYPRALVQRPLSRVRSSENRSSQNSETVSRSQPRTATATRSSSRTAAPVSDQGDKPQKKGRKSWLPSSMSRRPGLASLWTILCPYSRSFPRIPARNRVTIWISYGSVQASNLRVGGSNPSRRAISFQGVAGEAAGSVSVGSGTHRPLTHFDAPNTWMFNRFSN